MLRIKLEKIEKSLLTILCLGAHSDDIEIGCGGSILRFVDQYPEAKVHWVVLSASKHREGEAQASAELFLEKAKRKEIVVKGFRDSFFPYIGGDIKRYFEEMKKSISPDIIFSHYRHDLHQDHRLISELTWNTFRNHLILEYEIIKYDGDLGSPNIFVHLNAEACLKKIEYIMRAFKSQGDRSWFTEDAFMSIMRIRGIESNSPHKFAEGFYCKKIVL
ncbi:MAG TPA: PIG-L domain-containing protein [Cytophagales bacterium]|nr:PIG-L domain-containing protein [Cytophagales bacterium]